MRKFRINLDGVVHEVEIEEIDASGEEMQDAPAATAKAPTAPRKAAPKKKPAAATAGGGKEVKAPLQGSISKVMVTPGKTVKSGEAILVIEAMKMENEVVAPVDGTVASVSVKAGDKVDAGDLLVTFE